MRIRLAQPSDLQAIYEIYCPYILETTIPFETELPSFAQFQDRFQAIIEEYPWLVVEDGHEVIGYAYASRAFERAAYDWCCDLAVYFRKGVSHHGMAAVLYETLLSLLRLQQVRIVYALVTADNAASIRFHERLSFERVGYLKGCGYKFDRWQDVICFEKELYDAHPPLPFQSWKCLDAQQVRAVLGKAQRIG